jgi:DNA polymerase III subunit chi
VTDIGFYHLTHSGLEAALPQLLARTLAAGQRAVVRCRTIERLHALDAVLWEAPGLWLPHGSDADGDVDLQPIWLTTTDEAPNGARFLFLVDGADTLRLNDYERVFDLFDGNDEAAVTAARTRWRAACAAGLVTTYWRQTSRGWKQTP